ncbi:2556_t:CDS:2, partial [Dentiscutata heterogama]
LIPFITKYLLIQDLKNCYSLDDIWKTEAIREIRKRLIVDCSSIDSKTTVKALIDPKSQYNSISKALPRKMDLYITRIDGSKYPAVEALGVGVTNAEVSISLPNIFDVSQPLADLGPSSYLGNSYEHFLVVDKPEYDLVLGSTWLMRLGNRIDGRDGDIGNLIRKKGYITQEIVLIFYYSETESESSDSETEFESSDSEVVDVPLSVISGMIQDNSRASVKTYNIDFIPNHSSWVINNCTH